MGWLERSGGNISIFHRRDLGQSKVQNDWSKFGFPSSACLHGCDLDFGNYPNLSGSVVRNKVASGLGESSFGLYLVQLPVATLVRQCRNKGWTQHCCHRGQSVTPSAGHRWAAFSFRPTWGPKLTWLRELRRPRALSGVAISGTAPSAPDL